MNYCALYKTKDYNEAFYCYYEVIEAVGNVSDQEFCEAITELIRNNH